MQCDTIFSPPHPTATTSSIPFPTNPIPTTRLSIPARPGKPSLVGLSIKTRATINDGFTKQADISEMSFYELLGIPETGSVPEIKQAYKQLARIYHPDVSPPDRVKEHTERFIRVQEAYETLSDPNRRAVYDRDLSHGLHLAFSARRNNFYPEETEDKTEWRTRWQSQVSELKRRSMHKDSRGTMSWGARMRRQRDD